MNIKQIESAILQLPTKKFREFMNWLHDLDYQRWDAQIESDIANDKLNFLDQEAVHNFENGHCQQI
ncbi:DUF2281 domain-containing protein [Tumidithrix helvetica PCC 7403]|uniref:hypothetical protein n=1 Tax=Tumidithrix helvetica TaxID=3457545 RepID=UPI003C8A9FEE